MEIKLNEKVEFLNTKLNVTITKYAGNNNTAIMLVNDEGETFSVASVNVRQLPSHLVAIKNYSEGSGIEKSLIEGGIIKNEIVNQIRSGFVEIPIYELTENVIKQLEY